MKILLYGGTFDPPHYGHIHNVMSVAATVKPDLVIVMPAGVPPHKAASHTPAELRLAMCACFSELAGTPDIPKLTVSRWEIDAAVCGRANYTVTTLDMLHDANPDAALYLAVGSDMLLTFDEWHEWQRVLKLACLVVESREADDLDALHKKAESLDPDATHILFAHQPALPLSSTQIRQEIAAGQDCGTKLPQCVQEIIKKEKLYATHDS